MVLLRQARRIVGLLAVAAVGVGLAACTPEDNEAQQLYAELSESIPELRAERANAGTRCMVEQGFPDVETGDDGSTYGEIAAEQVDAYEAAVMICHQQICPNCGEPLDTAQWERLYSLELEVAKCLRDAGLDVPSAPSLQAYLDSPEGERYSPHRLLAREISLHESDLSERCPDPGGFVTYW